MLNGSGPASVAAVDSSKAKDQDPSKNDAAITLHFPPEALGNLKKLAEDFDTVEQTGIGDLHVINEKFVKASEMWIAFYEKLILLSGGSFALSLTFLGALHRATSQPLAHIRLLESAWILLLVSIVLSWLHNMYRSTAVEQSMAANAETLHSRHIKRMSDLLRRTGTIFGTAMTPSAGLSDAVKQLAEHLQGVVKETDEKGEKIARATKRMYWFAGLAGSLALWSVVAAFTLFNRICDKKCVAVMKSDFGPLNGSSIRMTQRL